MIILGKLFACLHLAAIRDWAWTWRIGVDVAMGSSNFPYDKIRVQGMAENSDSRGPPQSSRWLLSTAKIEKSIIQDYRHLAVFLVELYLSDYRHQKTADSMKVAGSQNYRNAISTPWLIENLNVIKMFEIVTFRRREFEKK